jgi:hypothetical protein
MDFRKKENIAATRQQIGWAYPDLRWFSEEEAKEANRQRNELRDAQGGHDEWSELRRLRDLAALIQSSPKMKWLSVLEEADRLRLTCGVTGVTPRQRVAGRPSSGRLEKHGRKRLDGSGVDRPSAGEDHCSECAGRLPKITLPDTSKRAPMGQGTRSSWLAH